MATLGKWSGGVIGSLVPTTSWAAPNGLFPTQDRNDGSAYSFASSTSTVTLPSSGLADGYLIVASFDYEDTSNGRHNPQGRIIQASGTGTFVGGPTGGYNRDNSEDRAYVKAWAFVDNPSASSTYQFQWRRDTDAPTGGTARSHFEVIPFFYADIGLYSSTSTTTTGGTTPEQVTGFSGTDGTNITLSSNVVTVTGDNKRYLVLGSQYFDGLGSNRTQRWHGLRIDGTKEDAAKGYSYYRNGSNNQSGELFTWLVETATASVTIDQFSYRGDGVADNQGGADSADATSSTAASHALVVIELNDSAEVFRGTNTGQSAQSLATAGTRVEVNAVGSALDFNDSASFTRVDAQSVNAEQDMDVLLGANLSGAYASVSSTARATCYGEFTLNGTGQSETFAGDYGRGNQGTVDTFGWSANLLSSLAVTTGQDIGVNAGKITGGETGPVSVQPAWAGFWGVNLDTLEGTGGTIYSGAAPGVRSASRTGAAAGTFEGTATGASAGFRSASRVGDGAGAFTGAFTASATGARSQSRTGDAAGTYQAAFIAAAGGLRAASRIGSAGATTQAAFQASSSGLRSAAATGDAAGTFEGAFAATADGNRSQTRTGGAGAAFTGAFTASADGARAASRTGSASGTLGQAAETYTGTADGARAQSRAGAAAGTFEAGFAAAANGNRAPSRTGEAAAEFSGAFAATSDGIRSAARTGSASATADGTAQGAADGIRAAGRTGDAAGTLTGAFSAAADGLRGQSRTGSAAGATNGTAQTASDGIRAATGAGEAAGAFIQPATGYTGAADGLRATPATGDAQSGFTGVFAGSADGLRAIARLGDTAGVFTGAFGAASAGARSAARTGGAAGLWVTFRVGRIVKAGGIDREASVDLDETMTKTRLNNEAITANVQRVQKVSGIR